MPCRDGRDDYCNTNEARRLQRTIDVYAQQLCRAMETLEDNRLLDNERITTNMVKWWDNHKRQDAVRLQAGKVARAAERVRAKALKKLSSTERKVLGLE